MTRPEIVAVDLTPPEGMVFFQIPHTLATMDPENPDMREMQVLPLGRLTTVDARELEVTVEDLTLVKLDLMTRKNDVPVLFEHGGGPRGGLAAGWIPSNSFTASSRLDGSPGLYGLPDFTDLARNEIRADGWRYVSPGFFGVWDESDVLHPRVLIEASLTNVPAIDGMRRVAASIGSPRPDHDTLVDLITQPSGKLAGKATVPSMADNAPGNDTTEETEKMETEAIKALIAESLKPIEARAEKLAVENTGLRSLVEELESKLAKMPDETKATVASFANEAENGRKLVALMERATKAGLVTDDTKESFAVLAKANLDATEKVVARAEALARAPRGGLYRANAPTQTVMHEESPLTRSQMLDAAVKLRDARGGSVREALREVSE
jgi:phage I-like protein